MKYDRILTDLISWIGQLLWYREKKVKHRPYEKLQDWTLDGRGRLYKVVRPAYLCPRDCGTYIFQPFRYNNRSAKDIHLCCDHLAHIDGVPRLIVKKGRVICTHRITILVADHWVGEGGRYSAEEAFSLDDDLQGFSVSPNRHVNCILYQMALEVSACLAIEEFDFLRSLDNAKRHCMRGGYTHTIQLPKPSGTVIAYPLDGGRPVRIKL